MKRLLIFIFFIFFYCNHAFTIPAYPHKIAIVINGQKVFIRLSGDEKCKHAESEDGYTILQNNKGQWCYAKLKNDSTLEASQWLLGHDYVGNVEFDNFIASSSKHLTSIRQSSNIIIHKTRTNIKAVGERRILVIMMEYKDMEFSKSKMDFHRLFNEKGYDEDKAQGSVKDFYLSASYNQLDLESDIYGPYTSSHEMSYYGRNNVGNNGNDINAYALFEEAITNVANETDLSQYDGDGDGFIDNVHIIFAGYGEEAGAASDAIWSHEATFYRPYEIQGVKIDRYSCAPELRGNSGRGISRIGPHCHEIGHALGAMDYYDTNYNEGGEYAGTGQWDVMASGSWNNEGITPADFNPYVKAYNYGWISPKSLPKGEVVIPPSCDNSESYYILKSSETGDYYMLENRSKERWGCGVPGEGLLIYHIHQDIANAGNEINATAPQKCYLVCASSTSRQPDKSPLSYGEINSAGCPYPGISGNSDFGQNSIPKAFYWNGGVCGIEIDDIYMDNDGYIHLTNNSIGADYEPVDMTNLFFEGFEDECKISILEADGITWKIEENSDNGVSIIDRPVAYEGTKCLQLSAKGENKDMSGAFEFSCTPQNQIGKLCLKFYYTSMHQRFSTPNIIRVGYRTIDAPDWKNIEITSLENSKWQQASIDFYAKTQIQFRIEGNVFANSIIAIDNIMVEQEVANEEACIKETFSHKNVPHMIGIYSLNGEKRKQIEQGLNIFKMSDGTYKKYYWCPVKR